MVAFLFEIMICIRLLKIMSLCKTVMSLGTAASEEDGALVAKLFGSVGKMFKADEKMFDAVTGLRYVTVSQCLSCSSRPLIN